MHATFEPSAIQIVGGWLLLTDMVLAAVLFAFWEKAGQMRLKR